jgi:Flp pilus assembly protein TadD
LAGCRKQNASARIDRLAILRFENVGAGASADWMGRAFSEIITAELSGAPAIYAISSNRLHGYERLAGARPVSAPGISAEKPLATLAGATRMGYGEYWASGGSLHARLTLEDAQSGNMITLSADAGDGDVIGAASNLARQLWRGARPYSTRSEAALKAYMAALETSDSASVAASLGEAISADPGFGSPYRLLAQIKAQAQDRNGALALVSQGIARVTAPADRVRLEVTSAELRGDPGGRVRALQNLSALSGSDPAVWRSLAEALMAGRSYAGAAAAYRRALAIEPQDIAALNQLGYAAAYAGDLAGAADALRRYERLRPNDANALDSLGDVNLLSGHLAEAESLYLQAAKRSPHFELDGPLFKAAMARLMTGDVTGADVLANQYLQARSSQNDPALNYRRAEWSWTAGRRKQACGELESFAGSGSNGPARELAARAWAQLAVWKLLLGDRAGASQSAERAAAAAGPASAAIAAVARFLTEAPASASEWGARAERQFPGPTQPSVRNFALAYALLLNKEYQPASAILHRIYDAGASSNDEGLPVMLAWTYIEAGRPAEAAPLLRLNPIPASSGTGPFFAFYFPRLYLLRSIEAQREGKQQEAQANREMFRKLSGPDHFIWDEEPR